MAARSSRRRTKDTGPTPFGRSLTDDDLLTSWRLALEAGAGAEPVSALTIRLYSYALRHLRLWCAAAGVPGLVALTREQALRWVAELRTSRAPKTGRTYVTAARRFYSYLLDEREIRVDPFRAVKAPTVPDRLVQPYSEAEVRRILKYQDRTTFVGLRNYALFLVLLDSGLRVSECAGLLTDQLDWKTGTLRVMGKGRKERIVRVGVRTRQALDRYLRERRRRDMLDPALWVGRSGQPLTSDRIRGLHVEQGAVLGIHMHPHRARHTALQAMLDSGMEREYVQYLAGHSSAQTLRVYSRTGDAVRAAEAHAKHSPVDRMKL